MKTILYSPPKLEVVELEIVEGEVTLQANKANVLDATGETVLIHMPTVTDGKENRARLYLPHTVGTSDISFDSEVFDASNLEYLLLDISASSFALNDFVTVDNGVSWYVCWLASAYPPE